MSQKLNIQKLAIKLIEEENLQLLQNIIDQSNMIKTTKQVTLLDQEEPKFSEEYEDCSVRWLSMAVVASKHT